MSDPVTAPLVSVCSEIGRGHPSYLDSVLLALSRLQSVVPARPVSQFCTGTSATAWRLAGAVYRAGSRGGPLTWLYNRIRRPDAEPSALALNLLGTDLRQALAGYQGICLVDHPLLARILASTCRVAYVHGEIAAPKVAAVTDAWRIFVPLDTTRDRLEALGVEHKALVVTGLTIEPELLDQAEPAFAARLERLNSDQPLTIGFFTSGAYPRPHIQRIYAATASVTHAGHRAVIFWGKGWLRAAKAQLEMRRYGVVEDNLQMVWARTRQEETARTARLLPRLDLMVAAAHERTNWALGLGLPMFALLPHIGPFARENFDFAVRQDVCEPLAFESDALGLPDTLTRLRTSGRLTEMARNGRGRLPVDGAETTARTLLKAVQPE